jgi:tRNA A37 methylthiotransferase MiaB
MAVEKGEIKRRSAQVAALAKQTSLVRNQRWMGWSGEILVDEKGKAEGSWIGRNFAYKPIVVRSSENLMGKRIKATVAKAFPTYLFAVVAS